MYRTVAVRTITSISGTCPRTPSADDVVLVSAGGRGPARGASNSASESSKRAPEINNQLSFEGRRACLMSMSSVVKTHLVYNLPKY